MTRGVNKVILIGNLGNDPYARSFSSGGAVCNVRLATSESWKDREGNPQERTEWHHVVFNDKLAEIAAKYLRKGSKIYVEGSLRTRKWQGETGQDRYITEVLVSELQMLDPAPVAPGPDKTGDAGRYAAERKQWATVDDDDDLPF